MPQQPRARTGEAEAVLLQHARVEQRRIWMVWLCFWTMVWLCFWTAAPFASVMLWSLAAAALFAAGRAPMRRMLEAGR